MDKKDNKVPDDEMLESFFYSDDEDELIDEVSPKNILSKVILSKESNSTISGEEIRYIKETEAMYRNNFYKLSFKEVLDIIKINYNEINVGIKKLIKNEELKYNGEIIKMKIVGSYLLRTMVNKNVDVVVECEGVAGKERRMELLNIVRNVVLKNDKNSGFIEIFGNEELPILKYVNEDGINFKFFCETDEKLFNHLSELHKLMNPKIIQLNILLKIWFKQKMNYESTWLITALLYNYLNSSIVTDGLSIYQLFNSFMNWIVSVNDEDESILRGFLRRFKMNDINNVKYEARKTLFILNNNNNDKVETIKSLFLTKHKVYEKIDMIVLGLSYEMSNFVYHHLHSLFDYFEFIRPDKVLIIIKKDLNQFIEGPIVRDYEDSNPPFKELWGEKAELINRFNIIRYVVKWNMDKSKNVFENISTLINYLVKKETKIVGKEFFHILNTNYNDDLIRRSFEEIKREIENVNVSLKISDINLLFSSVNHLVDPIIPNSRIRQFCNDNNDNNVKDDDDDDDDYLSDEDEDEEIVSDSFFIKPLLVSIEFRNNNNWPNEIGAIRQLKKLIFLRYYKSLPFKVVPNENWIDIYHNGYVFRVLIALDIEKILINNYIYDRKFYILPTHTEWIKGFSTRYRRYAQTVRIVKKWMFSHLFSDYISEELIEILVAHVFSSVSAYNPPNTALTGFMRFLNLLSTFKWNTNILFVNLEDEAIDEEKRNVITEIQNEYEESKNKPPMFIVVSYNIEDRNFWTKFNNPSPNIVHRLIQYSRDTYQAMNQMLDYEMKGSVDYSSIFETSFSNFDLVLELSPPVISNVPFVINFDSVEALLQELNNHFSNIGLFFRDKIKNDKIGVIWNPKYFLEKKFSISDAKLMFPYKDDKNVQMLIPNIFDIINLIKNLSNFHKINFKFNTSSNLTNNIKFKRKRKRK